MFALRPPLAVAVALVAVFAIFHGHAHGTELPPGAERAALQHGLRRRHRLPARRRHRHRCHPSLAVGTDAAARGRRRRRAGRDRLHVESRRVSRRALTARLRPDRRPCPHTHARDRGRPSGDDGPRARLRRPRALRPDARRSDSRPRARPAGRAARSQPRPPSALRPARRLAPRRRARTHATPQPERSADRDLLHLHRRPRSPPTPTSPSAPPPLSPPPSAPPTATSTAPP